jgi:hypothetical protein
MGDWPIMARALGHGSKGTIRLTTPVSSAKPATLNWVPEAVEP